MDIVGFLEQALFFVAVTTAMDDGYLGQDMQEQWSIRQCYSELRDGTRFLEEECTKYGRTQLRSAGVDLLANYATKTCQLTSSHLQYAKSNYGHNGELIEMLAQSVEFDCCREGVELSLIHI